jgi:hypothetical protein
VPDAVGALGGHLPHVERGVHELVGGGGRHRRQAALGSCRPVDGAVEPALAGDDHPLGEVAQHRVGRRLERAPGAVAAGAAGLAPDDLAAQQEAEPVLEDADHVGRQRPVRLAAQIGDVDGDATTGLELGDALGEHVLEHREVLDVGGGDVVLPQRLLIGLAREVRG